MRPYLGLVVIFGLSQLGSLAAAASIPKVIQSIIDGPITHHQLGQLLPMAGLLLLTYAVALPMLIAFAALHGVAWGLRGPFMQAIRADYFGRAAIGMILGLSYLIIVVGQVGGPMIAGILADLTGDYRLGFTIIALLAGLGSLFFVLARKPKRPLR